MIKFLIIKTSSLGDILQSFPFLENLRRAYPHAQIDWVVEEDCKTLIASHPAITNTLVVPFRRWKKSRFSISAMKDLIKGFRSLKKEVYDAVFDLQGNLKSSILLAQVKAHRKIGFGLSYVSEWPNVLFTSERVTPPPGLNIRDDYLSLLREGYQIETIMGKSTLLILNEDEKKELVLHLEGLNEEKILICPGAAWKNKQLDLEGWKQVLTILKQKERASYIFAWGTSEEKRLCDELAVFLGSRARVLKSKFSFSLLQNFMANMNLVVAMDSLPLHLAATTDCPTWSFFGPSRAKKYAPLGERHVIIQGSCPYGMQFEKRCTRLRTCPTGSCMKKEVISAYNRHIHGQD